MNFLIDNQILIWYYEGNASISDKAKTAISEPSNGRFVSMATFWEMAIKIGIGKLTLSRSLEDFLAKILEDDISVLPIASKHILPISTLPHYHKDPVDRLIISQAIVEDMELITSDAHFKDYPVKLLL